VLLLLREEDSRQVAIGGAVMCTPPRIFPYGLSTENTQGCVNTTAPPGATPGPGAGGAAARLGVWALRRQLLREQVAVLPKLGRHATLHYHSSTSYQIH
jgi:hypothetical protein